MRFLRKIGLKIAYFEAREEKLRSLDRTIPGFYRDNRPAIYSSTGLFFLGWMAEAMEVYVIIYYLGGPAIALSVFIKDGAFFIPGSLGAHDGGNMLLVSAFGYSDVTSIIFALLWRFRELFWIGLGLLCLTLVGERLVVMQAGCMPDSGNGSWLPKGCSFTFTRLSKSKSRKSRAPVESSGSVGPSRPIQNREAGDLRYVRLG